MMLVRGGLCVAMALTRHQLPYCLLLTGRQCLISWCCFLTSVWFTAPKYILKTVACILLVRGIVLLKDSTQQMVSNT